MRSGRYEFPMQSHGSVDVRNEIRAMGVALARVRSTIRWSQRELSRRSGVPQSTISRIERANSARVSLATAANLADAMGARLRIEVDAPILDERRGQVDPAHARMSGHVTRRLEKQGWRVASEVEISSEHSRGWIDLLAFHTANRLLLVIELKTEIHDLGRIDRTLGWYEREAWAAARRLGWRPRTVVGCLLVLMTQENDTTIRFNREALAPMFRARARDLTELVEGVSTSPPLRTRALAMVDPRSKRRSWIRSTLGDGRRLPAPYVNYAQFMRLAMARDPAPRSRPASGRP